MPHKNVSISDTSHLGDCIVLLILLNSTQERWLVKGKPIIGALVDALKLNLDYEQEPCEEGNTSISEILSLPKSDVHFLNLKYLKSKEPIKVEKVILGGFSKNGSQFFQLDAKSHHKNKPPLKLWEKRALIRKFNRGEAIGIGGVDTEKLDGFKYLTGDIFSIISWMENCYHFFGVDSGMSHLAGWFQVPSDIVITHTRKEDYLALRNFYKTMYPSTNCLERNSLNYKLML